MSYIRVICDYILLCFVSNCDEICYASQLVNRAQSIYIYIYIYQSKSNKMKLWSHNKSGGGFSLPLESSHSIRIKFSAIYFCESVDESDGTNTHNIHKPSLGRFYVTPKNVYTFLLICPHWITSHLKPDLATFSEHWTEKSTSKWK